MPCGLCYCRVARVRTQGETYGMVAWENGSDDVVDRSSIIENKERIKTFWEQVMTDAVNESKAEGKLKRWASCETNNTDSSFANTQLGNAKRSILDAETMYSDSDSEILDTPSMEERIVMELKEMEEREEELKEWRSRIAIENCKETALVKDSIVMHGNEDLNSIHTTDDGNYSEYGSEEKEQSLEDGSRVNTPHSEDFRHLRTQSLDSVSSGHSSGSGSTLNERDGYYSRKRIVVRPFEEENINDLHPRYEWGGKETPIEKDIRLAREREEELKREKGPTAVFSRPTVPRESNKNRSANNKEGLENDPRSIQHRIATYRIQQEIEEASEREKELRTEGKIISTSEETLDAKVTRLTELVESSILEEKFKGPKMKRSSSVSHLLFSSIRNQEKTPPNEIVRPETNPEVQSNRKYVTNSGKKGIMQKFISERGNRSRSDLRIAFRQLSSNDFDCGPIVSKVLKPDGEVVIRARKGFVPVTEKIQEELMDYQKREEELRLQRARSMARSQPNLLELSDGEGEQRSTGREVRDGGCEEVEARAPRLIHSLSNPNLLDDSFDKVHRRPNSKKFSLLEVWEKKIRENVRND